MRVLCRILIHFRFSYFNLTFLRVLCREAPSNEGQEPPSSEPELLPTASLEGLGLGLGQPPSDLCVPNSFGLLNPSSSAE